MTDTDSLIEAIGIEAGITEAVFDEPGRPPNEMKARRILAAVRRWEAENGWRCVPKEPVKPMLWAGTDAANDGKWAGAIYGAMVSASPPPPGSVKECKE